MKDNVFKRIISVLTVMALILACVIMFVPAKDRKNSDKDKNKDKAKSTPVATESSDATESPKETEAPTETNAPEGRLAGLTICIDPGHQSAQMKDKEDLAPWDKTQKQKVSSGTSGKYSHANEYEVVLSIGLKLRDKLTAEGANVVMTRETNDVQLSNIDRADIGNNCNADVVLRIHCNGAENASAEGMEMWVPGNGDNSPTYKALAAYDKELAAELLDVLCTATGAKKRNVNTSDAYTGLNWSKVPSIIMELGFMSNEKEDLLLSSEEYQNKIAEGIKEWLLTSSVLKRN